MHGDPSSPQYIVTYGANRRKYRVVEEATWCELCMNPGSRFWNEDWIGDGEYRVYCIQCVGPESLPVWVVVQYADTLHRGGHTLLYLADAKSGQVASRLDPDTWSDVDRARQYAARHGGMIAWVHESGEVRLSDGSPVGKL